MGEQPIFSTKAHVFQIDPNTKKKWLPASSQAVNVSYYYDSTRNTYRIISVEGTKAVINSTITPNMTFTKTSVKFGQWSDPRANTVYGLGFSSEAELTQFIDKFKEIKEMTRQATPTPPSSTTGPATTNGSVTLAEPNLPINENISNLSLTSNNSPVSSPKTIAINAVNDSLTSERNASTPALPEQLKYENDRLKIALAQSSANAKKWEIELHTLKNNNARLTTALQESTANVEEWKKQLAIYKEESARMKRKVLDAEKGGGGSELLHRQLADLRDKVAELERIISDKKEEIAEKSMKIHELKSVEADKKRLSERMQSLEKEKFSLLKENESMKEQVEGNAASRGRENQRIRTVQGEISSKINDLYGLNDKLAEMLQH